LLDRQSWEKCREAPCGSSGQHCRKCICKIVEEDVGRPLVGLQGSIAENAYAKLLKKM
jgi:hypothetical protein